MTFVFDTNVYFGLLLDPKTMLLYRDAIARAARRTYLSSVVLAELLQGARGDVGRARLRRGVASLERTGRLVTPTHADWAAASTAQSKIWDEAPHLRTKSVLHDALIAASARRIGATVVTTNVDDFDLVRPHLVHRAVSLVELAALA